MHMTRAMLSVLESLPRVFIACNRCGAHVAPGLAYRLPRTGEFICGLCRDDHETGHLAGDDIPGKSTNAA